VSRVIDYDDYDSDMPAALVVDKVVRLSKKVIDGPEYGETVTVTLIHLTTGEKLRSNDSIKTLMARMNWND
jgi:hypothetical protein